MTVRLSNGDDQYEITELIAYDEERDLALLKSDCTNTTPLALRADIASLQPGEKVYSFGSSLGYLYSSLGEGILAAFKPEKLVIDGKINDTYIVAISPNEVGDGAGYTALMGAA